VGTVTAMTSQTLTIQARVAGPAPQTNTATISHSDQFDPNQSNNTSSATETPPQADLTVTKQVNSSQVFFGSTAVFTGIVHNNGPDTATGVTLLDPLPAGLNFVQAAPSQGTYNPATGVWTVGTLANGATATIQITVQVNTLGPVVNAASVFADQFDPDLSNSRSAAAVIGMQTPGMISKRSFLATSNDPPATDFARALGMQLARSLGAGTIAPSPSARIPAAGRTSRSSRQAAPWLRISPPSIRTSWAESAWQSAT
jgi:uncharacterized repeat protein (TIGR01451 family)